MSEASPAPDSPRTAPLGASWKILIGCAVGCGGLLIIGVLSTVGFFAWLSRPGQLLEPSVLLGDDTTGYAEWVLRMEDPGTRGFVIGAIEGAERERANAREPVPDVLRPWLAMLRRESPEEQMSKILPMVAAWTLCAGAEPDDDLHLVTLSIEQLGNQMVFGDWMLGWVFGRADGVEVLKHRGERLYILPDASDRRLTFFIRGNDIFFSTDPQSAVRAVDRLEDGGQGGESVTELARLFERLPSDRALRAAVSNRRGELRRLWERWAVTPADVLDDETWLAIEAATLAGGLESDGSLAGTLALQAQGHVWTGSDIEHVAEQMRDGFAWLSQDLTVDGETASTGMTFRFRATDLLDALSDRLEVHDTGAEIRTRTN